MLGQSNGCGGGDGENSFIKEIHSTCLGFGGETGSGGGGNSGGDNGGGVNSYSGNGRVEDVYGMGNGASIALPSSSPEEIKKPLKPWWYPQDDDGAERHPMPTIKATGTHEPLIVVAVGNNEMGDDNFFGVSFGESEHERNTNNYRHLLLEYLYYYCYIHSEGSFTKSQDSFRVLSTTHLNPPSTIRLIEAKLVGVRECYFSLNSKKEYIKDLKHLLEGPPSNIVHSLEHLSQIINLSPYNNIIRSIIEDGIDFSDGGDIAPLIKDCTCIIEEYDRRSIEEVEDFVRECAEFLNNI